MNGKISWSRPEDVERLELKADGVEFSHRLITKDLHGSSFSFHITHIAPYFEHVAKGDGEHESVLYCLHGGSTQTLDDGTVHEFRPGDAMYLPAKHEYKRWRNLPPRTGSRWCGSSTSVRRADELSAREARSMTTRAPSCSRCSVLPRLSVERR